MKILQWKLFKVVVPRSIRLIFFNNKELIPNKWQSFPDSSLGIPYKVLWFNVCNKELLALRNNFWVTKKFLIAKFDCTNILQIVPHDNLTDFFIIFLFRLRRVYVNDGWLKLYHMTIWRNFLVFFSDFDEFMDMMAG